MYGTRADIGRETLQEEGKARTASKVDEKGAERERERERERESREKVIGIYIYIGKWVFLRPEIAVAKFGKRKR